MEVFIGRDGVRARIDGVIVVRDRLRRVQGPRVAMVADTLERVKTVGVSVHDALRVQIGDDAGDDFPACLLALTGVRKRVVDVRNVVHDLNCVGVGGNIVANADVHLRPEISVSSASRCVKQEKKICHTWCAKTSKRDRHCKTKHDSRQL